MTHDTTPVLHNRADSFSPDGREIVFARNGADGVQLYTTHADGTGITQITHGDNANFANWGTQPGEEGDN
jgi:Tol biopolymer transport system component